MIYDCCRGNDICEAKEIEHMPKTKGPSLNNSHEWVDRRYRENSGFGMIYANFENFSIADCDTHGGCLGLLTKYSI